MSVPTTCPRALRGRHILPHPREECDIADFGAQSGHLLIADISGYTAFLTGTELVHAHGIIQDLTRAITEGFGAPWQLEKLEGGAVFVDAPGENSEVVRSLAGSTREGARHLEKAPGFALADLCDDDGGIIVAAAIDLALLRQALDSD